MAAASDWFTTSQSAPSATIAAAPGGAGARLSTPSVPLTRADLIAGSGISALITRTSAGVPRAEATSCAPTSRLAPGATVMRFSPASSTEIMARPVGVCVTARTPAASTPSSRSAATSRLPNSSYPTQPTRRTSAPSLAAATAWLAPFPPGVKRAAEPSTVAPGPGSRGTVTEISMFRLPSTVTRGRFPIRAR